MSSPRLEVLAGPVVAREGGYTWDRWDERNGHWAPRPYPTVERALYDRKVTLRMFDLNQSSRVIEYDDYEAFERDLARRGIARKVA